MPDAHNKLLIVITLAVVLCGLITIAQIWGPVMAWDTYFKILITAGIVAAVSAFVLVAKGDMTDKKKMKDENYLD